MIFKPGDRVRCHYYGEEIFTLEKAYAEYQTANTYLKFTRNGSEHVFYEDGKFAPTHVAPLLTLVERPKEKVKRKLYVAIKNHWEKGCLDGEPTTRIIHEGDVIASESVDHQHWEELDLGGDE